MPTPTIDPMAYEAAYEAVKQYNFDRNVGALIVCAVIGFFIWMFKE